MKRSFTFLCLLLLCSLTMKAQKLKLIPRSSGYSSPVAIANCGDSRLFIVEQQGKIFIDSSGTRLTKPFLDITDRVLFDGDRGLLGLAFPPDYATSGFFYVNYIDKAGNTQISRFKVRSDNRDKASATSEKFILAIEQPFSTNKGGTMHFGKDSFLYIGTGDGGGAGDPNNNAQNTMSLLGKMLRIEIKHGVYKIPADNPFVDSANYKPEIWALGLRNPWGWSFDANSGAMIIGDVGEDKFEEIDINKNNAGGRNYGWRCYEGKDPFNTAGCLPKQAYNAPAYAYPHKDTLNRTDCSVIGGYVYRGSVYDTLKGKYIFTDYCSGIFRMLYQQGLSQKLKVVSKGDANAYSCFGEGADLELYVANIVNGTIYHITTGATTLQNNYSSTKGAEQNKLSFSPNPSKGNINISYTSSKTQQVTVRITSLLGEQAYSASKTVNAGVNNWSMNVFIPKGNYYLSVITNTGSVITQSLRVE